MAQGNAIILTLLASCALSLVVAGSAFAATDPLGARSAAGLGDSLPGGEGAREREREREVVCWGGRGGECGTRARDRYLSIHR